MAQSRPRPQSQAPPSVGTQSQSALTGVNGAPPQANLGTAAAVNASLQLTNYSLLFQQQSKQSEEVYALKFELRQVQSELDKQRALHQQDAMQLKNRITDILEQKEKSQQINDMLINSLRAAVQNQAHSKAYLLEFDYVCDMVRMYSNQDNRRKSSFIQQNAVAGGQETSLESVQVEPIECRTTASQTSGEPWPQANLTFTPKEKDLLEKLQQLEKVARETREAKDKTNTQKNEFASKLKEFTAIIDEQKAKLSDVDKERAELVQQLEKLKSEAQKAKEDGDKLSNANQQRETELRNLYESLQAKYQKKKKSAKERKHQLKAEIASLKRQLADTLQKAFNFSEENTQLKKFKSDASHKNKPVSAMNAIMFTQQQQLQNAYLDALQTARSASQQDKSSSEKSATENVHSTAEGRRPRAENPNQLNCNVSQFLRAPPATTSYFESNSQLPQFVEQQMMQIKQNGSDPSNLLSTGELTTREQVHPTKQIKQRQQQQKNQGSNGGQGGARPQAGRYSGEEAKSQQDETQMMHNYSSIQNNVQCTTSGDDEGDVVKMIRKHDNADGVDENATLRNNQSSSSFTIQLHSPEKIQVEDQQNVSLSSSLLIPNNPKIQPTAIPTVSTLKLQRANMSERQDGSQTVRHEPLTERTINTTIDCCQAGKVPPMKSHAKLFSKFVNSGAGGAAAKDPNTQQASHSQQKARTQSRNGVAAQVHGTGIVKNSFTNTGQPPTTNRADQSQQSLCLMGSIVQQTGAYQDNSVTKLEMMQTEEDQYAYGERIHQRKPPPIQQLQVLQDDSQDHFSVNEHVDAARQSEQSHFHVEKVATAQPQQLAYFNQPHHLRLEESIDQLVKIEASPEVHQEQAQKKSRRRKKSQQIKISPIKHSEYVNNNHQASADSPSNFNKHRSPCQQSNTSDSHQLLIHQNLSLAPVAKIDISNSRKTQHKSSDSTTSGKRYMRQSQQPKLSQQQQYQNHKKQSFNMQRGMMLVEEQQNKQQLSESRSCSIEHHNLSQGSIEGMIKFGLQSSQHSHRRMQQLLKHAKDDQHRKNHHQIGSQHQRKAAKDYRSPELQHSYCNPLDRSRSPNCIEREQIGSIIDEITDQLKTAELLNLNRQSSLAYGASSASEYCMDEPDALVETSPRNNMLINDQQAEGDYGCNNEDEARQGRHDQMFCQTQRIANGESKRSKKDYLSPRHHHDSINPSIRLNKGHDIGGAMTQREFTNTQNNAFHFLTHNDKTMMNKNFHSPDSRQHRCSPQQRCQTRDALLDQQSCCTHTTMGGNCTHYHNHYEGGAGPHHGRQDMRDNPVVSERLIKQCFDKIGQSLDQLATKDRIIQRLINDNFASDKKKSGLRRKLKQLRQMLQDCQQNQSQQNALNQYLAEEMLQEANTNLSFENEHLRDKVEKTQNLLKMYQLDSPLKVTDQMINRSISQQYDLEQLRKMAVMSFQTKKSQCKKQKRQPQQVLSSQQSNKQMPSPQQQILAKQRQELLQSMVNAGKRGSSSKLSCDEEHSPIKLRSVGYKEPAQRGQITSQLNFCKQSRSKEAATRDMNNLSQTLGGSNNLLKFSSTQKLGGFLTARQGITSGSNTFDTRCESNDASNSQAIKINQLMQRSQAMKKQGSSGSVSLQQQHQKLVPNRSRDGFLKASNHHLQLKKYTAAGASIHEYAGQTADLVKSAKSRYEPDEDEEEEDSYDDERASAPSHIAEFAIRQQPVESVKTTHEDIGDYDLPSKTIAGRSHLMQQDMNQNNLSQMHGRHLVVQTCNKLLIIQNQRQNTQNPVMQQSYQSENDESRVVYDYVNNAAAQFRGVQHPKKLDLREASPTIGEDSDLTQPDDFFYNYSHNNCDPQKIASPRNYYYNNI